MPGPINQDTKSHTSYAFHLMQNAAAGWAGGWICFAAEGLKKRAQTTGVLAKHFHPSELFRGSTAFATAVMVASASSMTFNTALKQLPFYDSSSTRCSIATAVSSGMLGAIVGSTPVENLILIQQTHKTSPIKAAQMMFSQGIARPFVGMRELMLREAGFALVMLYGGPKFSEIAFKKTQDRKIAFGASLVAGMGGAIITHPWDTISTYRQKLDGKISLTQAIKDIYASYGPKGYMKGVGPRIVLFTGCSIIIPKCARIIEETLAK